VTTTIDTSETPVATFPLHLDVELLLETLNYVTSLANAEATGEPHTREWNQGEWVSKVDDSLSCGTACCFAGARALLDEDAGLVRIEGVRVLGEQEPHSVGLWAMKRLGLDDTQADILFATQIATIDELTRVVDAIIEGTISDDTPGFVLETWVRANIGRATSLAGSR
jgi:hypothetical protein